MIMPNRNLDQHGNTKSNLVARLLEESGDQHWRHLKLTASGPKLVDLTQGVLVQYRDGVFSYRNGNVLATLKEGELKERDSGPVVAELTKQGNLTWKNESGQGCENLAHYLVGRLEYLFE